MPKETLGTVAEKPGCQLKKKITTEALPEVNQQLKDKIKLNDNTMIDAFSMFGGVESLNHTHDEFYCDGVHLNSAGSNILGV